MHRELTRQALVAALFVAALGGTACNGDPAAPRRENAASDSLLVARLVGEFNTADTVRVDWEAGGGIAAYSWMEVTRGPVTVSSPGTPSFKAVGTRADTVYTDPPPFQAPSVSPPVMTFWLQGDSLVGLWMPGSVPRSAVSDSGLHWSTTASGSAVCGFYLSVFVPSGATGATCRAAVHWRRTTGG